MMIFSSAQEIMVIITSVYLDDLLFKDFQLPNMLACSCAFVILVFIGVIYWSTAFLGFGQMLIGDSRDFNICPICV